MKTWLIKIAVGILGIALILAIPAGVWAMIVSGSGGSVPPGLQLAGTCVRVMLGLAVAATPGVLFWLAVLGIVIVTRRIHQSALWTTVQDRTRHGPEHFPFA